MTFFQGCADMWSPKALRASAGAHFKIPIISSIPWEDISSHIPAHSPVFLADNSVIPENNKTDDKEIMAECLKQLQFESQHFKGQNGEDLSFCEPEILEEYAKLPLETVTISNLNFPASSEIVIVLGGETHGLSLMARKLALDNFGASVYIPLRNQIDSLNVACAASIILYQFLEKYNSISK